MKTTLLFLVLLLVVGLSSSSATTGNTKSQDKERGVMIFNRPVTLLGVELKGQYLFVHDNTAMARGETCTFVYKGTKESRKNLVVAFHCTPTIRGKVKTFVARTRETSTGVNDLEEIQFAGSTEAHVVLKHQHR